MAAFDAVDGSPPNRQPVGVGKKEESHGISGYNGIGLTCLALFVPSDLIEIGLERSLDMGKKRPTPEQIVTLLRQIEVATSQGKSVAIACREAGISDQSYYRWRKEYGGLDLDQARRMKDLEKENGRLKRLVADLSLEKPSCGYGFGIYSCGPYLGGPYGYALPCGYYLHPGDFYSFPADADPYPTESVAPPQFPYWYYCDDPKGYYAHVTSCANRWRAIPAVRPPPAPG